MSMKAAPTAEMVNASNVISGKIGKRCASCTPFFQRRYLWLTAILSPIKANKVSDFFRKQADHHKNNERLN
ncbi:hypothetical protein [Bacillus haynesii]|uniref:hypothetical protein n=1 Tax=Bacillus haynesii TaxID=1925021 RepID=UPI003CFEC93F